MRRRSQCLERGRRSDWQNHHPLWYCEFLLREKGRTCVVERIACVACNGRFKRPGSFAVQYENLGRLEQRAISSSPLIRLGQSENIAQAIAVKAV